MTRNARQTIAIGLLAALSSLAGCAGKIRYPTYYVLNLPAPVSAASRPAPVLGSVAVREFEAPGYLRKGPIMYRESPEQLGFYEYHQWAVDPRSAITGAMIREIQSRKIFKSVDSFDGHGTPNCMLTGSIQHLEEVDRGRDVAIEVSLSARLVDLRTGEVLWQDTSSKTARLDNRSIPGLVAEMSRDLEIVVESLVSSMADHLTATPQPRLTTENR